MRLSRVRRNLESPLFKWLFAFVWPKNSFVLFLGVLLHVLISSTYLPVFPTKTTQIPLDNSSIFTVIIAKRSRSSQLHAIHSTWLQRMDRFHVFSDGTIRDPNVPQTRMPRVYKTWRSWLRTRWIAHFTKEHITDAYDWYLFVHDETFLMTEELKLLLKEHSPSEKIYFVIGENVSSRQKYAKAALVLNRASLDFLAATMHHHKHSICGNTPNIFDLHACFATEGFKKVDVDEDLQGKNRSRIQPTTRRTRRMLRISRPHMGLESPDSSTEDHVEDLLGLDSALREGSNPPNPLLEDDALKCPICFEVFSVPKMLVCCGRSICQDCEQRLVETRSYGNCPVCSSHRSISGTPLPINVSLRNAIELFRSSGHGMTSRCEECDKNVKVDEIYCCATCDKKKKICSHCALKKHKGHDIDEIGYVNKEDRETMVKEVELTSKPYCTLPAVNTVCNAVRQDFERALRLADTNLQKAKNICADIVSNNYMTEDMIRPKLDDAKKINEQVAKDYEKINKIKDDLHDLQTELSVDVLTRVSG
ncbi:hypothetical protein QR680_004141 [Steinernema hermaphroditum]|uniref:N-acetylgalactosaminide beta-1,3-galactosyltransferase n=1 Tax=Steinernema hermaphroditum TaxID=289476 RepID=A0AA39HPZ7_9BILA|nr:hypothetical protein QR680_004141 [Steinernema hermaphroditum]